MTLKIHPGPELDEGAAPDPGGFTPVTDEELKAALDAEGAGEDKPAATTPDKPAPAGATPAEAVYEINGKKYTAAQIDELEKGSMRLADYSRDKNQLTAKERELLDREQALNDREQRLRRGRGEDPDADPDEPESVEQRLERLESERQQDRLNTHAERADSTYQRTFDDLCKQHEVTDPAIKELIDLAILGKNPDTRNLGQLQKEVTEIFTKVHGTLSGFSKAAIDKRLESLRKTTKVPSSKGAGVVPVAPGAKPKKSFDDPVTDEELAEAGGG